ncbi:MAG: UDP-N-acetylmuramoyl-L-alanyl-D-glutamate--2,6-diaminopimelate ligase [Oscillospiraceae bacterium]|nr:UDP-N-acetylmuramoyl-L-alanyl-D-glutamate--2,6-diaminopimelate ligase [Oscillospiraceae bacterium]
MVLSELLKGIQVLEATVSMEAEVRGVSYDSRQTAPGDLFIAVTGYETDGHLYIPKAKERGAALVLCERRPETAIPYVRVASTREALAQIGANWFGNPADQMTMIGVTGTNGKTTVTTIFKSVLEQTVGAKVGLIGTIQNMIGDEAIHTERTTPESFEVQRLFARMRDAGCTHVVMEVSSHALVLHRVDCVHFAVGAFTNLTQDHLDFHKTMEEYRKAKSILFRRCDTGVFNLDDPAADAMIRDADCRILTNAETRADADFFAKNIDLEADRVEFDVVHGGENAHIIMGIPGQFTVYNVLTVIGCASALGIPLQKTAAALREVHGVKGRIEVVPTPGRDFTVLIDYAVTPDAIDNILRTVRGFCKGRLIAVFGCGGDRDRTKRPIMAKISLELADLVVFTSDNPRTEDPFAILRDILKGAEGTKTPYYVEENRRAAIRWAMDHAEKDDIIVLAGKGHETYQILGKEKTHLDEREEVAAHLLEMKGRDA